MNKEIQMVSLNQRHKSGPSRRGRTMLLGGLAVTAIAACAPVREPPQQVQATTPTVSYNYSTDDGLVQANTQAQTYCSQYASTPVLEGSIVDNSDGTRTVTFRCVKTAASPVTPIAPTPSGYEYRSDAQFVQALRSADTYCAQTGQTASTRIVSNPDGSKTMTFDCVPR